MDDTENGRVQSGSLMKNQSYALNRIRYYTGEMDDAILSGLVNQAKQMGFDTDALIYVNHEPIQD